jgi:long-chain acyl-CoA synthetase
MSGHAINGRRGVLLTGATGFLGGEVLARLLERGDQPVYALVRAANDEEAAARLRATVASLLGSAEPWCDRVVAVAADITQPALGLDSVKHDWLAGRVARIVHCAASVSFTLGLDESRAINVEGTRRLLDLGNACAARGELESFVHVSTAYVAGTHAGRFGEEDLDVGQRFRNAYERSKFEAELLVRERSASLPVQVVRPSIVVGDSRTGFTPAFNVLYWPLRAFSKGAYPVLPARRSAPVDVVPVDYVADAILALDGRAGTTYHLTAGERASSVGELLDLASTHFRRPAPRALQPDLYRRAIHPVLVRTGSKARRRTLRRSEAFFPYFAMGVRYDNARAREALQDHRIEAPPLPSYFGRLIDYAEAAAWGRDSPQRHEAAR